MKDYMYVMLAIIIFYIFGCVYDDLYIYSNGDTSIVRSVML